MSGADNKRLVRRFIEEVINTDRIDAIDRVVGGCIVEHWGAANTLEALLAIGALPLSAEPPSEE
jgi:predicted SnoaL-like aldol condensation-catalyzing enzyme